ncbi:MAG: hypothetical protein V4550_18200 [Gemmatimonadota bacterium]
MKTITMFACGRPKAKRCDMTCNEIAIDKCSFELMGDKEGETCNRPMCAKHSERVGGKRMCLAHVRFAKRQAAARAYASVH